MKKCAVFLLFFSFVLVSSIQAKEVTLKKPSDIFKECAKCHGKDGKNRPFDRSGPIAGRESEDLLASMMLYKNDQIKGKGVTLVMIKQIKSLNEEEIRSLALFLSKL